MDYDKHYFNTKGMKAEKLVQDLAEKSFLTDWCYQNPSLKPGQELCDLLVIFDEIAIILQIKDLKLKKGGELNKKYIDKNIKQVLGAYRKLFELKTPISLNNARRGSEVFDPTKIKETYLLSILTGEPAEFMSGVEEGREKYVHVFDREFTEIILNELDTISDFIEYLRHKEDLLNSNTQVIINGSEKELLARYLTDGHNFDKVKEYELAILESGMWDSRLDNPQVKEKNEIDKISYAWDKLINIAHTCGGDYEPIAREFARLSRFERRSFAHGLIEGFEKAQLKVDSDNLFRRLIAINGLITLVICYYDDKHQDKLGLKAQLTAMATIARCLVEDNTKVIGIGSDITKDFSGSFTFMYLDAPKIDEKLKAEAKKLQEETGIFKEFTPQHFRAEEYPRHEQS